METALKNKIPSFSLFFRWNLIMDHEKNVIMLLLNLIKVIQFSRLVT